MKRILLVFILFVSIFSISSCKKNKYNDITKYFTKEIEDKNYSFGEILRFNAEKNRFDTFTIFDYKAIQITLKKVKDDNNLEYRFHIFKSIYKNIIKTDANGNYIFEREVAEMNSFSKPRILNFNENQTEKTFFIELDKYEGFEISIIDFSKTYNEVIEEFDVVDLRIYGNVVWQRPGYIGKTPIE